MNPNRRDLLLILGTAAVGVAGLPALHAADHDTRGSNHADGCAEACAASMLSCSKHVRHCTQHLSDGHKHYAKCLELCIGCLQMCGACVGTCYGPMGVTAAEACAKACDMCAAECERIEAHYFTVTKTPPLFAGSPLERGPTGVYCPRGQQLTAVAWSRSFGS